MRKGCIERASNNTLPVPSEQLAADGFAIVDDVVSHTQRESLILRLAESVNSNVGSRTLLCHSWCREVTESLQQYMFDNGFLHDNYRAVQGTYFEKSAGRNWLVPFHQDKSIPVSAKTNHPELKGWSTKEGVLFVQAPQELAVQLVALRLHLDECGPEDGPLRVIPGSHRRIIESGSKEAYSMIRRKAIDCLVPRGGALIMSPLLLHASSKTRSNSRRRVLHFLFGPRELPFGLEWMQWQKPWE